MLEMMTRGIYVHIPFCIKKCNYCDFVSFPSPDKETLLDYLQCLKKEIKLYSIKYYNKKFTSVYFGGGTPTILDVSHLKELLDIIKSNFNIANSSEITVEANPGTLEFKKVKELKDAGFNRISIGVQSTSDKFLKEMGRVHTASDVKESLKFIRRAGFENVNVDLIYGLPAQTLSGWLHTLQEIVAEKPPHIAAYGLKIEKETYWGRLFEEGNLLLPDEDEVYNMYVEAGNFLKKNGYVHYEISNWAKPGYESKHNKVYWLTGEYLGIGLNAASYLDGTRFTNTESLKKYIQQIKMSNFPIRESYRLSKEEQMSEAMIMALRLREGVRKDFFKKRFGCFPEDVYGKQIKKLVKLGLLKEDLHTLRLTEKGFPLANIAMVEFV
ncbi:MAG: hypothetical protein PWQ96_636 [Clostridia bacterium]|nr:oxygen-independent coproporphyrinogen oxidase [Clostridiales bacterium]MDK2984994.1 hypothetical protein [Clostridia bacterium]